MIITKAISTKLKASRHVFLRHFCTEIQKNTTNGSGVETKSQTDRGKDRRTDGICLRIMRCFILLTRIERFLNGSKFEKEYTHNTHIHTHTHTHTERGDIHKCLRSFLEIVKKAKLK